MTLYTGTLFEWKIRKEDKRIERADLFSSTASKCLLNSLLLNVTEIYDEEHFSS